MAKLLLGVTGSVAAIYTPELVHDLKTAGFEVKVVATDASQYFFDPARLDGEVSRDGGLPGFIRDADEWPGERYRRGDPVLHIELRRWADILLISPLDANTLAKLAGGFADNCLTCVYRAWDPVRPIALAPAMNTFMWEHPATRRHFVQLMEDRGLLPPHNLLLFPLLDWLHGQNVSLKVIPPISKTLACADVGMGAMAERDKIIEILKPLAA